MSTDQSPKANPGRRIFALMPLAVVIAVAVVFAIVLRQQESGKDLSVLPSPLVGKAAPALALDPLPGATLADGSPVPALTTDRIKGKLTLVNIWASWCVPCRQEHPIILGLSKDERLTMVGINYKDKNANALGFLSELGNPFSAIGVDPRGAAAIDWGVYGIPESYLVGPDGTILYKHVGPFDERSLMGELFPAIEKALGGAKG